MQVRIDLYWRFLVDFDYFKESVENAFLVARMGSITLKSNRLRLQLHGF